MDVFIPCSTTQTHHNCKAWTVRESLISAGQWIPRCSSFGWIFVAEKLQTTYFEVYTKCDSHLLLLLCTIVVADSHIQEI